MNRPIKQKNASGGRRVASGGATRRNPSPRRRRNPRGVDVGKVAVIGGLALGGVYAIGEANKYGGLGKWINHLGQSAVGGTGAAASAVGTTASQALGTGSGGTMSAALTRMVNANPNIVSQARQWQALRSQRGQDAASWAAFEAFEVGIKAPDPGATAPPEWPNI